MNKVGKMLRASIPDIKFELKLANPPIPDGYGGDYYIEPIWPPDGPKAQKSYRRDINTGMTATLRQCAILHPELIIGIGQGAIIALSMAAPRVMEQALAISFIQPEESKELRPAWFDSAFE